jgi:hypothetical protein
MDQSERSDIPGDRFLRDLFDIFINPEISRRRAARLLPEAFQLHQAQVIMNVDAPRVIRLNDEVRALMKVKVAPGAGVQKGAQVYWDEIDNIEAFQLTEEDPNAGHATIIRVQNQWLVFFDFRYNAQRVAEVLDAADQFMAMCDHALALGHPRPFMENLFAVAELTAKAKLLMFPDEHVVTSKSHSHIRSKINRESKLGNIDAEFVSILNELERTRGTARYVAGKIVATADAMQAMLTTVKKTLATVKASAPKRSTQSDAQ